LALSIGVENLFGGVGRHGWRADRAHMDVLVAYPKEVLDAYA
jgi:hypothetical protein